MRAIATAQSAIAAILLGCTGGRLSLATGIPIPAADTTGATLYYTPYASSLNPGQIPLYNGTSWVNYNFSELSIALPAIASTNYDVFCYLNSGSPTLELLAWTSNTARATALGKQNGVWVKSTDSTRRYLGTIRTTTAGNSADTAKQRFVWNLNNRVSRAFNVYEATASWTNLSTSWHPWNSNTANKVEFVQGIVEDPVRLEFSGYCSNGVASSSGYIGIGLDSTTVPYGVVTIPSTVASSTFGVGSSSVATFEQAMSSLGYHYLQLLETTNGTTTVFYGGGTVNYNFGATGAVLA